MKIRKARKEDLERISEIFRIEFSKPPYSEEWNKEKSIKVINKHFNKNDIYIIEIDEKIGGFIIIEEILFYGEKICYIHEITISLEFQKKGLGKKLMKFAEIYCKKKGIKKIKLSVNKKSHAFKFYKKTGYKEIASVSMEKNLK